MENKRLSLREYAHAMGKVGDAVRAQTVFVGKKAKDPERLKTAEDKRARKLAKRKQLAGYV